MRDFKKLQIWEMSHKLTLYIYDITASFPKSETFGLTSQLRRAVASVPTNIAEGCGRNSNTDTAHFIQIAIGSLCETEYHIILAHDLGYISYTIFSDIMLRVNELRMKMIKFNELIRSDEKGSKRQALSHKR